MSVGSEANRRKVKVSPFQGGWRTRNVEHNLSRDSWRSCSAIFKSWRSLRVLYQLGAFRSFGMLNVGAARSVSLPIALKLTTFMWRRVSKR